MNTTQVGQLEPGESFFYAIAQQSSAESIQALVDKKAVPKSSDLEFAVTCYTNNETNAAVVKILLNAKAEPTAKAVEQAFFRDRVITVGTLLQHKAPVDTSSSALLDRAISNKLPSTVIEHLVNEGVPVGPHSLSSAARLSEDRVVQLLIQKGAKLSGISEFTEAQDFRTEAGTPALSQQTHALLRGTISKPAETVAQDQAEVLEEEGDQEEFAGLGERPVGRSCWRYLFAPFIAVWSCIGAIFSCIWSSLRGDTVDLSGR